MQLHKFFQYNNYSCEQDSQHYTLCSLHTHSLLLQDPFYYFPPVYTQVHFQPKFIANFFSLMYVTSLFISSLLV